MGTYSIYDRREHILAGDFLCSLTPAEANEWNDFCYREHRDALDDIYIAESRITASERAGNAVTRDKLAALWAAKRAMNKVAREWFEALCARREEVAQRRMEEVAGE